jgi:hypothetical protein
LGMFTISGRDLPMEDGSSLGIGSAERHPKGAERGAPRAASAGLTTDPEPHAAAVCERAVAYERVKL